MDATHWDGCWQEHHACAREEIHRLRRELAGARKPVDDAFAAVPEGYVLVPREPTDTILRAGHGAMFEDVKFSRAADIVKRGYKAMLDAAMSEESERDDGR